MKKPEKVKLSELLQKKTTQHVQKRIEHAVKQDWPIAEIQPVIYLKLKECTKYPVHARIGMSERIFQALSDAGILTIKDLCEETEASLYEKCPNTGATCYRIIIDALSIFDRHNEAQRVFLKSLMPNYFNRLPRSQVQHKHAKS